MDPNGTRYHLFERRDDWDACREEGRTAGLSHLGWNDAHQTLALRPLLALFPRGRGDAPLDPANRRGAARDAYGNWFWIGAGRRTIYWLPVHERRPIVFWTASAPAPCPSPAADFAPSVPPPAPVIELAGLAVTTHHHLVVGDLTRHGLLLFDLRTSGAPVELRLPPVAPGSPAEPFEPFDIAAGPHGSVVLLDRRHARYVALDRHFRIAIEPAPPVSTTSEEPDFAPGGTDACVPPPRPAPLGFAVDARDPIAVEVRPDGTVLILDSPAAAPVSRVLLYRCGRLVGAPLVVEDEVEAVVEGTDAVLTRIQVLGYDMAWAAGVLYVVERSGNQVIAFTLDPAASPPALGVKTGYFPLHFFGGRALVASDAQLWYDVVARASTDETAVRWVALHEIDQPRYDRRATIVTPVLDGKERDCVWHRVFLDACIPGETSVAIFTRADNDPALVETIPFTAEPLPYLRSGGSELPFTPAFPDRELDEHDPFAAWKGTWEVLIQRARGRYLQARLVLLGNGRASPELRALRIYYPRVSYPRRFLPAVYLEDDESADLLERLLANPEGFLTEIEARIADVPVLLDARSTPRAALDWLAAWVGLIVDPLWQRLQERRTAPDAHGRRPDDRRRLLIRFARLLFERRGTPSGVRFALECLLHPCLEHTLRELEDASVRPDAPIHRTLDALGVRRPTAAMAEPEIEDLLWDLLLAPGRPSRIRIVERFLTRGGRSRQAGDPTAAGVAASLSEEIAAHAHRFSVLVPEGLDPDEAAMVERIVNLEKPAHAAFDVRRYWEAFRVDEARLGLDTVLGEAPRFLGTVLGKNRLADGYLHPPYPMDVTDRLVADRDRLGALPAL